MSDIIDIATGVKVECADGPCGRSRYVILDPTSATVTHVVVAPPEGAAETHLVPLDHISESSPELMRLSCTREELEDLPRFSDYRYDPAERPNLAYSPAEFWMGPLATYWPNLLPKVRQHVPPGELSIRRGALVEATDGHVGSVDEFLVEPSTGHIAHLVLREGHLWGRRDVVIPLAEIDRIEQDAVYLKMSKEQVGALSRFYPGSGGTGLSEGSGAEPIETPEDAGGSGGTMRALMTDLGSGDRKAREDARRSLVRIGLPAVTPLTAALRHENPRVRWEAAKTLQQIGGPETGPAMVAALEDEDPGVRWIAAEGLSRLGRGGMVPLLEALSRRADSSWLQRGAHHALTSLADHSLRAELAPVLAALDGVEPALEVPIAAHEALARLLTSP